MSEATTSIVDEPVFSPGVRPTLPPGPRLPTFAQTLLVLFAADRYGSYLRRRFESLATLKVVGVGRFVVVWEPALIREVLTGDPDVLRGGEANARFLLGAVGASSVMVLDGEQHLRSRRLLSPPFHGEAISRYEELVTELAVTEIESWPVGEMLSTRPRMQAIALEVILHAVIGVRDEQRLARLRPLLSRIARAGLLAFRAEAANPKLPSSPLGRRLPWLRARREADELLYTEIADHRADPNGRHDILSLLIAAHGEEAPFTDEELRDQLMTLLIAGQETTATALAWCFERLVRHPEVLARIQRELAGGNAEQYLDAVVNETLRVRPIADSAARILAAPLELGGYLLPAGAFVTASIAGVQHSNAFDDPNEFRPERFLDRAAAPYTLIPFGGGTHRCIGASFATMEMKTILRVTLERLQLRAPTSRPERPVRWRRVTTTPSHDGRVIVSAKVPSPQLRRGESFQRPPDCLERGSRSVHDSSRV